MRAFLTSLSALLLFGLLTVASPQAARADEEPKDESAASKAYRDAWWAETGGGNLNQALELYAKSVDAEGPASVKARALYRRAVVLQRIGKTEEALRALERLSKDFPGEAQVNTDARARLAEWTAVDLRSSFADWFKRYQYSPEFQAKVIDLVLKLGSLIVNDASAAERELLTIGAASIPALREHVSSKNDSLRVRAVKVLLMQGEVPDDVTEAQSTAYSTWTNEATAWASILRLPAPRRAALQARLAGTAYPHEALRAALEGPDAVVAWLASPMVEGQQAVRSGLLRGLASILPPDSPLLDRMADVAVADGQVGAMRRAVAQWAVSIGKATAARVKAWADHPWAELRQEAWSQIEGGRALAPAEAWPVVLGAIERHPGKRWGEEQGLGNAFHRALEGAPWPQDLDRAADALLKTGGNLGRDGGSARYADVLARAVERSSDEQVTLRAVGEWLRVLGSKPEAFDRLARWARTAATSDRRSVLGQALFARLPPDRLGLGLDLVTDPALSDDITRDLWTWFFANAGSADSIGRRAVQDPAALRRLLDRLLAAAGPPAQTRALLARMLLQPITQGGAADALMDVLFAAPDRVPWEILRHGELQNALFRSGRDRWRKAFREGWGGWSPAQRTGALSLGHTLLDLRSDPESVAFLRARLRARPSEVEKDARYQALASLGALTLDDLRAVYDLSVPEDVDDAARWLASKWEQMQLLDATREVFDALSLALRPDGMEDVFNAMRGRYQNVPEYETELVQRLLAFYATSQRGVGVLILVRRSSPDDEKLWIAALKDPDPEMRASVAKGMERVPTEGIKRALVGALDDPHPDVRAAALASLENLQKMEDLKARWRERVK